VVHSGVTPSLREIGRAIGYNSPRSVQLMLARLQKRGVLAYSNGEVKLSLRRTPVMSEQTVEVPLVGSVACGLPSLAEQDPEAMVQVSTRIARPGHTYFLLRAHGTSMNAVGINPGDLVLVRQQASAEEGDKVVALINDQATIKEFHRDREVVILKPRSRSKEHKPIVLSENFLIQGVVTSVLTGNLY